ncbi:MAG: hypothetical protein EOM18_17585, partial [Clostridia bacterium]|nr:hypothetical protein [Clostridia bacterium]
MVNKIVDLQTVAQVGNLSADLGVKNYKQRKNIDIDISLGKPLDFSSFIKRDELARFLRLDDFSFSSLKANHHFQKIVANAATVLADQHSSLVTVNHEHIFSYVLAGYRKRVIKENDFRNRCYLCLEYLKSVDRFRMHSSMRLSQSFMLTDDPFIRFDDFFHYAVAEGWLERSGEYLILKYKQGRRADEPNLIEIFDQEFSFFAAELKQLRKIRKRRSSFIRKFVRNIFIELDAALFEQDYQQFYSESESRPAHIGEPFLLKRHFSKKGVLLIHGYMAAPAEMRLLAEHLYAKGYTVYVCRLRGHGTVPEDLALRYWQDWYESVNRGYIILKNSCKRLAVVGFSTGAGLALLSGIR